MKENWTYKTFGDVGTFLRGKSIQKADFVEKGLPCVHYGQIHTKFGVSVDKHLTEIPIDLYNRSIIASHGDVLIAITSEDLEGSCKSTAWLGNYDIAVSSHAAVYKHNLNPKFVAYYLRGKSFYYEKMKYARGFKVMEIKTKDIEKIAIPVPPLSEQQRIVEELDLLSSIIEKKKEQLKEYDKLAQSLFYDMFGDPITNEKGWDVKKLKDISLLITDGSHYSPKNDDKGQIPMLSVKDMSDTHFVYNSCKWIGQTEYKKLVANGCKPLKNDVLIAKDGSYFKHIFVLTNEREQAILSSIAILRPIIDIINPLFVAKYLSTAEIFAKVEKGYLTGSAIKRVILKGLRELPIFLPPLSLQQDFAERIEKIEQQKSLVQQSIVEMQTLFDCTMDKYFG